MVPRLGTLVDNWDWAQTLTVWFNQKFRAHKVTAYAPAQNRQCRGSKQMSFKIIPDA